MAMAIATVPASWAPQTITGRGEFLSWVAGVPLGAGFKDDLLGEIAGDEQALDFAGAFVDLRDARVAVMALHRVIVQVAVAAVDLYRLRAHPLGELGSVELGLRGFREARHS